MNHKRWLVASAAWMMASGWWGGSVSVQGQVPGDAGPNTPSTPASTIASDRREDQPASFNGHPGPYVVSVLIENDMAAFNPFNRSDRHYTNGLRLNLAYHPQWAHELGQALPLAPNAPGGLRTAAGLSFGQNIYTPDNEQATNLIPNDRPYAGWLYGGMFLQRASADTMDHFELDLGMVGKASLAHQTQDFWHDVVNVSKFKGWEHQLQDEPGFNLILQRRWKFPLADLGEGWKVEAIPHAGLIAGTVNRELAGGATFRLGWNLPPDFGPGSIAHPVDYTGASPEKTFYLFVRLHGRFVERNSFVQGNQFHSSHGVAHEPLVGEGTYGLVWQFCPYAQLSWSNTYLTHEYKGQPRTDSYGTIMLTVQWDF